MGFNVLIRSNSFNFGSNLVFGVFRGMISTFLRHDGNLFFLERFNILTQAYYGDFCFGGLVSSFLDESFSFGGLTFYFWEFSILLFGLCAFFLLVYCKCAIECRLMLICHFPN